VSDKHYEDIIRNAEQKNSLFSNKGALRTLGESSSSAETMAAATIVGRADKIEELVTSLVGGLSRGYSPPFIFVYGRTGSGKSIVVRSVCEHLQSRIIYRIVNLRGASTLYGAAVLMVKALVGTVGNNGGSSVQIGRGMTAQLVLDDVANAVRKLSDGKLFVLVLDEFDVLLSDKINKSSDFIYKLAETIETLTREHYPITIVAIMNNHLAATTSANLGERITSRLGAVPEVFFEPYRKEEVFAILKERATGAFVRSDTLDSDVLAYISEKVAIDHGDARRAIDMLRVSAEIAGSKGDVTVTKAHVDIAINRIQRDRIEEALGRAAFHTRAGCKALLRLSFLLQGESDLWFSTSTLYDQYKFKVVAKEIPPVGYRRFSDILAELENLGLAVSRSNGKYARGYGREYRLAMPPETVGSASCYVEWWRETIAYKEWYQKELKGYLDTLEHETLTKSEKARNIGCINILREKWRTFVGLQR
jgi:cell division control protein 6